jgi:HD-GYP domain-containing protein (c-di-GMP phosphodiesterase class II)
MIVEASYGIWETYDGIELSSINVHDPGKIYPQSEVPDCLKGNGEFWVTGFPLVTREKNIGSLWVAFEQPISESNMHLFLSICDIVAEALKRGKQYEQTQLRLQQLAVLHDIDSAILRNDGLITIFDVALKHLMEHVDVHAAAVLLLNSASGKLECVHGQGIQSLDFYRTSLFLEECLSGRFSIHNRSIDIFNVFECQKTCKRADFLINRGFMACYGVPLTIQGEIIGVIEIFNQQILDLGKSRVAFLEIIATKIAKAIANTGLFTDLFGPQTILPVTDQSNIEGLSHALNLQDKETEAHSQRAAKMTVLIAKSMGIHENRLERIQKGSLLHDIGKMGVPENIINKPGPLSDDEWEVVRRHPVYAYNLIKHNPYLQNSIDIPYCHHEKWDGTGYPQGLIGEQIPIAARIFAVTDVWDALRSNRPYRSAWTANQARNFILQQSGKHFDPQVVEKFFELALDKTN